MVLPVADGIVTQIFGPTAERLDSGGVNKGIDISAPIGTPVVAPVSGVVIQSGEGTDGWGIAVKIRDDMGYIHNLGHLSATAGLNVGQRVEEGTLVGKVGSTGASTGPHLSWDIKGAQGYVDPSPWAGFQAAGDNRQWSRQRLTDLAGSGPLNGRVQTGATTMAGGRFYEDPAMDREFEQLRQARQEAFDAWVKAGRPSFDETWGALEDAQALLDNFVATHETFRVPYEEPSNAAQDAFDNAIRLGDFNLREADSAFNRWFSKTQEAHGLATQEAVQRAGHNADLVALQEARNASQTPGLMPRARDAGYIEQPFSELYEKYKTRLGVGDGPFDPDSGAGISGVSPVLPATGSTGVLPSTPNYDPESPEEINGPRLAGPASGALYSSANQALRSADGTMSGSGASRGGGDDGGGLLGTLGAGVIRGVTMAPLGPAGGLINAGMTLDDLFNRYSGGAASTAKKTGSRVKDEATKWWKRAFAEGGTNIPAGPAWVGERGPEIHEVPGFGARMVGMNGPEEAYLPEGSNIIPLDEALAFQKIRQAAQQPAQNPTTSPEAQAQRANDPQLREKVLAAIRKGVAANLATNPPKTPILTDPRIKDYWAPYRQLTGIPAFPQAEAEATKK